MKKIITFFLNIILFGMLLLFAASISVDKIAVHTISQQITGAAGSHRMMDVVVEAFPKADTDKILKVQNAIKDSPVIEEITEKYIDKIAEAATLGVSLELPDIKEDMDTLLEENMSMIEKELGTEITEGQKQEIKEKLEEKSEDVQYVLDTATQIITRNTTKGVAFLLKAYYLVTSFGFRAICLAGIATLIILISLVKKSLVKGFFSEGISFLFAGISLVALLPAITQKIGGEIANRVLGGYLTIDVSGLKLAGVIMLVIAVIMEVIYVLAGRSRR